MFDTRWSHNAEVCALKACGGLSRHPVLLPVPAENITSFLLRKWDF